MIKCEFNFFILQCPAECFFNATGILSNGTFYQDQASNVFIQAVPSQSSSEWLDIVKFGLNYCYNEASNITTKLGEIRSNNAFNCDPLPAFMIQCMRFQFSMTCSATNLSPQNLKQCETGRSYFSQCNPPWKNQTEMVILTI